MNVLVIDDQIDVADALGSLLRSLGHRVAVAYEATAALELMQRAQPELAIVDLSMPFVDGYELARQLRAKSEKLRLIAISGHASIERSRALGAAGFEDVVVKPPDISQLLELVERPLPRDRVSSRP